MRWQSPFPTHAAFAQADSESMPGRDPSPELLDRELASLGDRASDRRRSEFVLGRIAARTALRQLGVPDSAVTIGQHREPVWPGGVVGTITHSGGTALAAVAWARDLRGIGLDLERLDRHFDGLLEMITDEPERSRLDPTDDPRRVALEVFSAKEALYKALFPEVGRFFGFDAARARRRTSGGVVELELTEDLDVDHPAGSTYRVNVQWHGGSILASIAVPSTPVDTQGDQPGPG